MYYLTSDGFKEDKEEIDIYNTICEWLSYKSFVRNAYTNEILSHIRFKLLPIDILIQILVRFEAKCGGDLHKRITAALLFVEAGDHENVTSWTA